MEASHNIKVAEAFAQLAKLLGQDQATAVHRLTELQVEGGHDRLVTDTILLASERRLEEKMDVMRKDFDSKFSWVIGMLITVLSLLVTTLAGVLYVIMNK